MQGFVRKGVGAYMLVGGPVAGRPGPEGGRGGLGLRGATDEFLMSRVAGSDDERALSELYDRYGGLVYRGGVRYLAVPSPAPRWEASSGASSGTKAASLGIGSSAARPPLCAPRANVCVPRRVRE